MTLTVVSEISVELVGSGSREVGSVYTLPCTVALSHRASDSSVSILWEGPSTHKQTLATSEGLVVRYSNPRCACAPRVNNDGMPCGSPGGGRARGAGVRKAAAIAAATSSRMRPRTAISDMAIGVAPVAVAGGGVAEREVPGSSTIERREMGSSQKVKQQNNR